MDKFSGRSVLDPAHQMAAQTRVAEKGREWEGAGCSQRWPRLFSATLHLAGLAEGHLNDLITSFFSS